MTSKELRLIARKFFGFENALKKQVANFEKLNSDISVSLEFVEVHDLFEKMVVQNGCLKTDYDMILVLTDWIPRLVANKALLPINKFLDSNPIDGWPDDWTKSLRGLQTDSEGNIYGIAYHDGPEVFHYRRDLFENDKERNSFSKRFGRELRVPQTWSEFLDVAKFFTRPEEDLWGTVVAAYPDGHNNVYDFMIQLLSRGGMMFDQKQNPVFDREEGIQGLQYYVDLIKKYKVCPEDSLQLDSVASGDYYAQGKAAMMWNWSGFAAVAQLPDQSKIVGDNICTVIPRGDGPRGRRISINVYYITAITASSKNPDEAYAFIRNTVRKENDKITSLEGGTGTRISTWHDSEILKLYPFYSAIEEAHSYAESPPAFPEFAEINEILNEEISNATHNNKPVKKALGDAAERARKLLRNAY